MTFNRVNLMQSLQRWHDQAEEARVKAESFREPAAKDAMLHIAESYEALALRARKRLEQTQ